MKVGWHLLREDSPAFKVDRIRKCHSIKVRLASSKTWRNMRDASRLRRVQNEPAQKRRYFDPCGVDVCSSGKPVYADSPDYEGRFSARLICFSLSMKVLPNPSAWERALLQGICKHEWS
uniref:Uncharacterized protein n=1 Tax=Zooxanthella nutricula TaxID=1333877 RepID=A0A7S2PC98_9DINO|mmetsp:Transcript_53169/g.161527  ORF Transcript_53169/g.161527 Transcript_53169/m.161527 type:complete len:119 (+) Transcript_53169:3-359(+)